MREIHQIATYHALFYHATIFCHLLASCPQNRYHTGMTIWGLIIGGIAGLAIGGPIGGLLGAAAGHLADRQLRPPADSDKTKQVAFTVAVIALSAKMAKIDGHVTRSEIEAFRRKVHIPKADIARVGKFWDLARQTPDGFEAYARQTVSLFGPKAPILEQLLELLFFIARADKDISASECAYLEAVAGIFGYNQSEFNRFVRLYGTSGATPWQILGVAEDADTATIQAAWKQLVRTHHPDKLIAEGMPQEFVAAATERLASINAAYNTLNGTIQE